MELDNKNLDFCFENSLVKVIANRNYPEIKLAGLTVGPFEEGNEYEIYFWVAQMFAEQGIAHFREEDSLDAAKLYKVIWKERVQIAGQISELPEDFYPKLRRYLASMKEEIAKQPEKVQEYEKAKHLAWDIVDSRLKKIVALSAGPAQTDQVLKKFTSEEKFIYQQLGRIINEWKAHILEHEGET
ncbi:MAG: hypothetical protein NWE99_02915 [Candidatus Bathyarchaeota archaeon]|nr:hypothetical protein [Candidatus Bathyarchaeota archaeon]